MQDLDDLDLDRDLNLDLDRELHRDLSVICATCGRIILYFEVYNKSKWAIRDSRFAIDAHSTRPLASLSYLSNRIWLCSSSRVSPKSSRHHLFPTATAAAAAAAAATANQKHSVPSNVTINEHNTVSNNINKDSHIDNRIVKKQQTKTSSLSSNSSMTPLSRPYRLSRTLHAPSRLSREPYAPHPHDH